MKNVIIIGNGPAGISAGIYCKRANIDTTIIGKDIGALKKAKKIENYYGFANAISGEDLAKAGIEQAKKLGCTMICEEVISLAFDDTLIVKTATNEYQADAVLLATGSARNSPKIDGIARFEGSGVSYCAVCDAFFHRGKSVCVLGNGAYALHEAQELLPIAGSVTILTDGKEIDSDIAAKIPEGIKVDTRKIKCLNGENVLENIEFVDSTTLSLSGLFIAVGVASSSDLARKIGAQLNGINIAVNEKYATNINGLYAAGDCIGGFLQIAKAVNDGAQAAVSMIGYIRQLKSDY